MKQTSRRSTLREIPLCALALLAAIMLSPEFMPHAVAQSVPVCRGKDLMAQMRKRQPLLHAVVYAEASNVPNGEAVLWRIETDQAGKASWLLGTIHMSDDRVARIEGAKRRVLDQVATVALEVIDIGDKAAIQREIAANPGLIAMPQGRSLWDLVGEKHRGIVADRLSKLGISRQQAAGLQPWLPAMLLSKSACQTAREGAGVAVLDQAIEDYARARGARLVGLETASEQFAAMSSMPLASQAVFLADSARMSADIDDLNETMIQLYLRREIPALLPFQAAYLGVDAHPGSADATRDFIQALIVKRNRTMAQRARALLREGNALIAVGALHLPGNAGLVALFRQQGFRVTPVE